MTSSFLIKKRLQEGPVWDFGDISSHYLMPFGDCLPGDVAIPIGNSWGVKVCKRPEPENTQCCGSSNLNPQNPNGENLRIRTLNRGSVNLYDPSLKVPVQQWNPQRYEDRRIPNESLLLQNDYLRWPMRYNATGLETMHGTDGPNQQPFYSYGYSYMGMDNTTNTWAPRSSSIQPPSSTLPSQVSTSYQRCPTPIYDRTRAVQPTRPFKIEQEYIQNPNTSLFQ